MIPDERRRRLLHLVEEQGSASIAALTEALGVSHMTVRRDVSRLEEAGRLVSVAGGVTLPSRIALDATHQTKLGLRPSEKEHIAARAAQLVGDGDVIYLDAGTTMLALARQLVDRAVEHARQDAGPTGPGDIITNDLAVAAAAGEHPTARVHVLGGQLDSANLSTQGPLAAAELDEYNIDLAFVSASSFDLRGLSVPSDAKTVVKRALVDNATHAYLATDSSKYGKVAAFRAVPFGAFDGLITDSDLPEAARERARDLGVELLITD
ncbi:DeoR/GlpR family DNA-binding transcription regulator [Nesterenkonia sp. HG001]|uniref:DeoR/GlpR family DNA-binding transcription regulator n=1 Tax=Nesterenkonia sp. HG001 TaxID=2983207 RepID=UPI002AC45110|nr:DeoR/GlpR family DNA-binding transcription regulator [Nesterenkonia sp. HG001]MDZ5077557.1 DeoR/GlpR family DNA-binding transcription regulator [Nesterenkonia sp. HG001]